MLQTKRILIGIAVLIILGGVVLGIEYFRGQNSISSTGQITLTPGSIPIYLNGDLAAGFVPDSLQTLEQVSFTDSEEGKLQEGWLLKNILLSYLPELSLEPGTKIIVSSSSRQKSAELSWAEVEDTRNMVMFDLSNRGTIKLVSLLEEMNTRDEWVQDVDRIEVVSP